MSDYDRIGEYGPALARVARAYERDPGPRAELAQEMAVAIWRALPRLRDGDSLRAFVFRIAHNRAVSHVIARTREPKGGEDPDVLVCDRPGPERALIEKERQARLLEAIRALPLPHCQPLLLLLEGLSYAEIAEALALSETNVGVRINRAKQKLKAMLGDE
jgi:RNA polymerase sigma-70 factor (ECF subfamily)